MSQRSVPIITKPPVEGGSAEAVDEHNGLPGALLDVVYPATPPRPEVVPVRFERQNLQPCTHGSDSRVTPFLLAEAWSPGQIHTLSRAVGRGWRSCHGAGDGERDPGLGHQLPPLHHQEPAPCQPMAPATRISQYSCLERQCVTDLVENEGAHRSGRPVGNPRRGTGRSRRRPSGGRPRTRRTSGRQGFWRAAETLEQRTGARGTQVKAR